MIFPYLYFDLVRCIVILPCFPLSIGREINLMGDDRPAGSISTLIKTIRDITASVAALTAYMVAIFGLADIPYAKTTSLLTILATSIVVVNWRWHEIVRKREPPAIIPRKARRKPQQAEPAPKPAFFAGLLQPL